MQAIEGRAGRLTAWTFVVVIAAVGGCRRGVEDSRPAPIVTPGSSAVEPPGTVSMPGTTVAYASPSLAPASPALEPLGPEPSSPALAEPVPEGPAEEMTTLRVQVLLDRAGFSPGEIDGQAGSTLQRTLTAFSAHRV